MLARKQTGSARCAGKRKVSGQAGSPQFLHQAVFSEGTCTLVQKKPTMKADMFEVPPL